MMFFFTQQSTVICISQQVDMMIGNKKKSFNNSYSLFYFLYCEYFGAFIVALLLQYYSTYRGENSGARTVENRLFNASQCHICWYTLKTPYLSF